MKLCLSSGSCSLEEAEMDTYNADPMHAGKNTAIEAGTKPWRNAGHRELVHSDWEIWGSLRQMHGSCSLSLGNKLRGWATSPAHSCAYTVQAGPRSSSQALKCPLCDSGHLYTLCALPRTSYPSTTSAHFI